MIPAETWRARFSELREEHVVVVRTKDHIIRQKQRRIEDLEARVAQLEDELAQALKAARPSFGEMKYMRQEYERLSGHRVTVDSLGMAVVVDSRGNHVAPYSHDMAKAYLEVYAASGSPPAEPPF